MAATTAHRPSVLVTGGRYPFRPTCSCGWATWGYLTKAAAQNVAGDHEERTHE